MWIAHHKRILLWHTARNILAIFHMLQIAIASGCVTEFDNVQSKALLSQIVIVGRIQKLELTRPQLTEDYQTYTALVQVLSVIKQPKTLHRSIRRRQHIPIEGFLNRTEMTYSLLSTLPSAQSLSLTSATNSSSNGHCLSYVNALEDYILFINRTSSNNLDRPTYHTAQLSTNYTKTDKKLIKDVLCVNCGMYHLYNYSVTI